MTDEQLAELDRLFTEIKSSIVSSDLVRAEVARDIFDAIHSDVLLWHDCHQGDDPVSVDDIVCISVNSCLGVLFDKLGYVSMRVDGKDVLVKKPDTHDLEGNQVLAEGLHRQGDL